MVIVPILTGLTVTLDEDIVLRTRFNSCDLTVGTQLTFYSVRVNTTHFGLFQSYATGTYVRYWLYINSPNNTDFDLDAWFVIANTTGQLELNTPISTDISIGFYSPTCAYAYATGVSNYTFYPMNNTLLMVANSDTSTTIIIHAIVGNEELPNVPPVIYDFEITDMEGCGNWLFSETSYYHFQLQVWDGNGYDNIDTTLVQFNDTRNNITVSYNQGNDAYLLINGSDVISHGRGTTSIIDPNLLQVTFRIYIKKEIYDSYNVSISAYANDTSGTSLGWNMIAPNYVNIYSLGGNAFVRSSGIAGTLTGGDIFDIYARNNSWANSSIVFRNLQHIKVQADMFHITYFGNSTIRFGMDYCVDNYDWIRGLEIDINLTDAEAPSDIGGVDDEKYMQFNVTWSFNGTRIKSEFVYMHYYYTPQSQSNVTTPFWLDLWFNKINSSSVIAGRINAYEYPIISTSNDWFQWLTGSDWGINEERPKESMVYQEMTFPDGSLLYTKDIRLVRVWCYVWMNRTDDPFAPSQPDQVGTYKYHVIDLQLGTDPFTGVITPYFDETIVPTMPHSGGFLGTIVSWLGNVIDYIKPAIISAFNYITATFIDAIDLFLTIFNLPDNTFQGFITMLSVVFGQFTSVLAWVVDSILYLINWMGNIISLFGAGALDFISVVISATIGNVIAVVTGMFTFINDFWNGSGSFSGMGVGFSELAPILAIALPLWFVIGMLEFGSDWGFNILSKGFFFLNIFKNIVMFGFTLIYRVVIGILELIPF
jgi:hypothetical protein